MWYTPRAFFPNLFSSFFSGKNLLVQNYALCCFLYFLNQGCYKRRQKSLKQIKHMPFYSPLTCIMVSIYPSPITIIFFNDSFQFIWIFHLFTPLVARNYKEMARAVTRIYSASCKSISKREGLFRKIYSYHQNIKWL